MKEGSSIMDLSSQKCGTCKTIEGSLVKPGTVGRAGWRHECVLRGARI